MTNLLEKYGRLNVPRYTSYPTAPHFKESFPEKLLTKWLGTIPHCEAVSLYVHIPYCREICWYCGCSMKLAQNDSPIKRYVDTLLAEISLLHQYIPGKLKVSHLHFGGGTPTILPPGEMDRILEALKDIADYTPNAEIAIECDPRTLKPEMITHLGRRGFNRVSFGIQEFSPNVQAQINRIQPPEMVQNCVSQLRAAGLEKLNLDVLYGLPDQTTESLLETLKICVNMQPDRFALFGYAHVPWMAKRQRMIDEAKLPGLFERAKQAQKAAEYLTARGYQQIGFDHFALPDDPLAIAAREGNLSRNFQGYSADKASTLIGLGSSSISTYEGGYVQNETEVTTWRNQIESGHFAVRRGLALAPQDYMRRALINDLMCKFSANLDQISYDYGASMTALNEDIASLEDLIKDGLLLWDGETLTVTETGKPFVRVIAARFDSYLGAKAKHSVAV